LRTIKSEVVVEIFDDVVEAFHSLLLIHGKDGHRKTVRVTAGRERFSLVPATVFVLETLEPVLGRSPLRRILQLLLIGVDTGEGLLVNGRGLKLEDASLVELFEGGHDGCPSFT